MLKLWQSESIGSDRRTERQLQRATFTCGYTIMLSLAVGTHTNKPPGFRAKT